MKKTARKIVVTLASLAMVFAVAGPAVAAVQKSGSINCGTNAHIVVNSLSYGPTRHYAPSSSLIASYDLAWESWTAKATSSQISNGTWKVEADGGLQDSQTKATCRPGI